jgi:2'-5' RNA ligase
MVNGRAVERYSLWLMPAGGVREWLVRTLRELSVQYGAPAFPPHVTLLGGITEARGGVLRRTASLAALLRPFIVQLGEIDCLDQYFRSLFARAAPTPPLLKAHQLACQVFGHRREPLFMPHLSLLYGDFSQSQKDKTIDAMGQRLDLQFKVQNLFLYSTRGEPSRWRQVARLGLK